MPNRRTYEDELGRVKRVDRSVLAVVARQSAEQGRDLYVLDPKRPPEKLGKRRKPRA